MQRRKSLLAFLFLLTLSSLANLSWAQPAAPRFILEKPVVTTQDANLLVAVMLKNDGGSTAENVVVTKIVLGPATVVAPGLSKSVGDIASGEDVELDASFLKYQKNGQPPLLVMGKFTYRGRTQSFQANVFLPAPKPLDADDQPTIEMEIPPSTADGAIYPPEDTFDPMDANEEDKGFPLPEGKLIGNLQPDGGQTETPDSNVPLAFTGFAALAAVNDPVQFYRTGTTIVQNNPSSFFPWDPSGASVDVGERLASKLVFLTGNTYALMSTDGGATFTKLNPTTIFPNNFDGGLCCDQVIQYIPSINRVVWFMQFNTVQLYDANGNPRFDSNGKPIKGKNRIRIASASPTQIINSNGTSWTYWDMTAYGTFNFGEDWIDYPDMSYTNNFLHISIDRVGTGLFVIRCPLNEIRDSLTIHLRYTNPSNGDVAYGSHMTQDSTDAGYWFGQVSTSQIRVFEWKDSSNSYSWRTLNVNSWKKDDYVTKAPNGVDWLSFGFGRFQVRGATVVKPSFDLGGFNARTIKVAWSAARGGGFAQPYVRLLDITRVSGFGITAWAAGNNQQIWNSQFAFQHPYMSTNADGEVGINLAYGGPNDYPTPLVGFVGDSTMYYLNKSGTAINRWGDYSAIRKHPNNPSLFSTSDYYLQAPSTDYPNGRVVHQYRLWGRGAGQIN